MSVGKRGPREKRAPIWIEAASPGMPAAHPFYERLNQLPDQRGFDRFAEETCGPFYSRTGRPGLLPGIYFRLLLVGYFEGLDSERGIAWRAADSFALRSFPGFELHQTTPDHTTISQTRRPGLGTMTGWKRIVVTVGEKMGKTHLSYAHGAPAELVAMGRVFAGTRCACP